MMQVSNIKCQRLLVLIGALCTELVASDLHDTGRRLGTPEAASVLDKSLLLFETHMTNDIDKIHDTRELNGGHAPMSLVKSVNKNSYAPKVAMLYGFPWSGQQYLQREIHDTTHTTTAIVYGTAAILPSGFAAKSVFSSIPLYKGDTNGPFAYSPVFPFPHGPNSYVLTRSFCAGHCMDCQPNAYVITSAFRWSYECGIGDRYDADEDKTVKTWFNTTTVEKNVHLIRSPFTNIPARFENEHNRWETFNKDDMLNAYPKTGEGYAKWCHDFDDFLDDGERRKIEKQWYLKGELWKLSSKVKCHTDLFRYIQWHNYAFEVTKNQDAPIIFYDDMMRDKEGVTTDMHNYLGLTAVKRENYETELGEYDEVEEFLTEDDKKLYKDYIKLLASEDTWNALSRYFSDMTD